MPPVAVPPDWPMPRLQLRIEDLDHEGTEIFLNAVNPQVAMREAVMATFRRLYTPESVPQK